MTLRVAVAALAVAVTAACSGSPASVAPTFNRDVAPLLHAHCSNCHQPLGSGPFDLLTYNDARKRARQIADVTASGYMPPWLPELRLPLVDVWSPAPTVTALTEANGAVTVTACVSEGKARNCGMSAMTTVDPVVR